MSPAISGEIGLQGQQLSGFMGQQQLAAQQAADQMRANLEQQRMQQEAMLREMAILFGGY